MPNVGRRTVKVSISDGRVVDRYANAAAAARENGEKLSKIRSHCYDGHVGDGDYCYRYEDEYVELGPIARKGGKRVLVVGDNGYKRLYPSLAAAARSEREQPWYIALLAQSGHKSEVGMRVRWA